MCTSDEIKKIDESKKTGSNKMGVKVIDSTGKVIAKYPCAYKVSRKEAKKEWEKSGPYRVVIGKVYK